MLFTSPNLPRPPLSRDPRLPAFSILTNPGGTTFTPALTLTSRVPVPLRGNTMEVLRDNAGTITGVNVNGRRASNAELAAYFSAAVDYNADERFDFDTITTTLNETRVYGGPARTAKFAMRWGAKLESSYSLGSTSFEVLGVAPVSASAVARPDLVGAFIVDPATYRARVEFSTQDNSVGNNNAFANLRSISVKTLEDADVQLSNNGARNFLRNLKTIEVIVDGAAINNMSVGMTAELGLSASNNLDSNAGIAGEGTGFLDGLETIRVVGSGNAAAEMSLSHEGSDNFMRSLQSIYLEANGRFNSADLSISASANDSDNVASGALGENFMRSLRSITMISNGGQVSCSISHSGRANFMSSLQNISIKAYDGIQLSIQADNSFKQGPPEMYMASLQSIKTEVTYNEVNSVNITSSGGQFFMRSLKTIEVINRGGEANLEISHSNEVAASALLDGRNFMAALDSIRVVSQTNNADLEIESDGGSVNFMRGLKSIYVSGGATGDLDITGNLDSTALRGENFMAMLQTIHVESGRNDNFLYRADVSIVNSGIDRFMASLKEIKSESFGAKAKVSLTNNDSFDTGTVRPANAFMASLQSIRALSPRLSDVRITNETGSRFLEKLQTIEMTGYDANINLKGPFDSSIYQVPLVLDVSHVRSSAFIQTHDVSMTSATNRPIVVLVGVADVQYNAIYEIDSFGNYAREDYLFDDNDPNEDFSSDLIVSEDIDQYGPYEYLSIQTIYTGDQFTDDFAAIEVGAGCADGWSSIGSNGIQDVFKLVYRETGDVVIGGYEDGLDKIDLSALRDVITGDIIDQSDTGAGHVSTDVGDILVTQASGNSADAVIWFNTKGETTQDFDYFESWMYVVGGSSHDWTASDFIF